MGPLPKQPTTEGFIGKVGSHFKTASSAAWPPELCKWAATVILSSFKEECKRKNERKEDEDDEELPPLKRRRTDVEEKGVIDPMDPPVGSPFSRWRRFGISRALEVGGKEGSTRRRMGMAWKVDPLGDCEGDGKCHGGGQRRIQDGQRS